MKTTTMQITTDKLIGLLKSIKLDFSDYTNLAAVDLPNLKQLIEFMKAQETLVISMPEFVSLELSARKNPEKFIHTCGSTACIAGFNELMHRINGRKAKEYRYIVYDLNISIRLYSAMMLGSLRHDFWHKHTGVPFYKVNTPLAIQVLEKLYFQAHGAQYSLK
jgi:hypothetical protein